MYILGAKAVERKTPALSPVPSVSSRTGVVTANRRADGGGTPDTSPDPSAAAVVTAPAPRQQASLSLPCLTETSGCVRCLSYAYDAFASSRASVGAASCDRFAARPAASGNLTPSAQAHLPRPRLPKSPFARLVVPPSRLRLGANKGDATLLSRRTGTAAPKIDPCVSPIRAVNEAALVALIEVIHAFIRQILHCGVYELCLFLASAC